MTSTANAALAHRTLTLDHPANGGPGTDYATHIERQEVLAPDGTRIGTAHTTSYQLRGAKAPRPVAFVFNGGPGVSSVWLHLGGVGPFRVAVPTDLQNGIGLAHPLEENHGSLLARTDLVFVDPIGTGYGRRLPDTDDSSAIGVDGDVDHFAQLITNWLDRHGRLGDPVFLIGESYGTIRAALLATRLLQSPNSVCVEGVALLGQALNAQETTQRPGNLIGFIAAVPYLAVTASYHGLGEFAGEDPDSLATKAHEWALTHYAPALIAGDLLPSARLREVAEQLSRFCGLSVEQLLARNLRPEKEEFRRLLLDTEGLVLGLVDSRYTTPKAPPGASEPEFEAASLALDAAFTAAITRYLRDTLGAPRTEQYLIAAAAHERWNYQEERSLGAFGGSPLPSPFAVFDYSAHLRSWMRSNERTRLFIGTGHYDALTTVGSAHHLLAQNALPRERVTNRQYAGGHMMYTDPESCKRLGEDLRAFIAQE